MKKAVQPLFEQLNRQVTKSLILVKIMLKRNKEQILKYGAVIGLLVFLYFIGLARPVANIISQISGPFLANLHSLSSVWRGSGNGNLTKEELATENEELKKEINSLLKENARLKAVAEENIKLRQSLNFFEKNNYHYLLGRVISRGELVNFSSRAEEIIVNRGARDGVVPGLVVLDSEGIVVGKVAAVKEATAKVYLTTSRQCKLAATISGQSQTSGITEGELGLTIKMNFIPQEKEIRVGDIVVTSGLEQYIPAGLVIGRITEINKESSELWQTANLTPLADFNQLTIISILLP
jgi:rod shape-determining protein MreC